MYGSEKALRELYSSHYYMIEAMIVKSSGSTEDARDIFQDAVVVFYNKVKEEQFELKSKISTYLYSVSRNIYLKKIRKSGHTIELDINKSDREELMIDQLEYTESQSILAEVFRKIGEPCRKILFYFYYEKMKMQRIAKELNYASEQVAKNQKSKCMKKLRALVLSNSYYKENLENLY